MLEPRQASTPTSDRPAGGPEPNPGAPGGRRRPGRGRRLLAVLLLRHPLALAVAFLGTVAFTLGGVFLIVLAVRADHDRLAQWETYQQEWHDGVEARHRSYEERIEVLSSALSELERKAARRDDVEAKVVEVRGAVHKAMADVKSSVHTRVADEIERSLDANADLAAARAIVKRFEEMDTAVETILRSSADSVCIIQGAYGFARKEEGQWRFLREVPERLLRKLDTDERRLPLTLEGDGQIFRIDYTATGFLADASGLVLTNRHIAEPWWRNEDAAQFLEDGFTPRFLMLRAYFPGRREPFHFDVSRSLSSTEADIALLICERTDDLPVPLTLAGPDDLRVGRRVLLLGYPSGMRALLAKAGEKFVDRHTEDGVANPEKLLDALATEGMVRPLPTEGRIGDVLKDKILYDAPTAVGASGGPVFDRHGRVLAVNFGILNGFRSANFGVPIAYGVELLERVRR
jgi:S1-C subfamily serine protease